MFPPFLLLGPQFKVFDNGNAASAEQTRNDQIQDLRNPFLPCMSWFQYMKRVLRTVTSVRFESNKCRILSHWAESLHNGSEAFLHQNPTVKNGAQLLLICIISMSIGFVKANYSVYSPAPISICQFIFSRLYYRNSFKPLLISSFMILCV